MKDAATLLVETARRGELHHAIILHGPSPAALRDAALRVAKALNCLNRTAGDQCLACQRIDRGIHPDVRCIEVGGDRKMISVEQIRDLITSSVLRPYEGRNKVFIIDPADALSPGGSNSLLKTLEEPVRDTTFILLTRSSDLLLPTIRSRSQAIHIGGERKRDEKLAATIAEHLRRFAENEESAALLALASEVAGADDTGEAMALLADVLCDAAAGRTSIAIPRDRLLAAAHAAIHATRWLVVNADPRMLVERALAELANAR